MYFLALFFSVALACADDDFSKEVEKATQLTPSMYMIEGAGGNITASIGSDGTFLVDDDFAPMADKLVSKLRELKGDRPRFIVNTHFHYDHTGGNEVFGSTATIIAATAVRDRLMAEQILWKKPHPPEPEQALPTVTFDQSIVLHLNGDEVRVVHFPHGHTDGDSVVFFKKSKIVAMGDLYFSGMYPIFHPEHEGSLEGYLKNISWVLKEVPADAKVVAGHGPLSTRAELENYVRMISATIVTVRTAIKRGRTLEQIQKAGMAKEWEPFSHGYRNTDQWLESVYKSLK